MSFSKFGIPSFSKFRISSFSESSLSSSKLASSVLALLVSASTSSLPLRTHDDGVYTYSLVATMLKYI
jgi:hypothetical protein